MGRAAMSAPGARQFVENLHALKRLADPAEIARAALFLASDASSFVTGTAMLADGGVSIHRARRSAAARDSSETACAAAQLA
jgi:NAD(P)-dependent dehydrogenase (short-subunit alcohol dehydrogenase family)